MDIASTRDKTFFGSYVMGYLRSANLLDPSLERTSHEIKPMVLCFTVEGKKRTTKAKLAHHYSQKGSSLGICWLSETHIQLPGRRYGMSLPYNKVKSGSPIGNFNTFQYTSDHHKEYAVSKTSVILFVAVPKVPVVSTPSGARRRIC